MHAVYAQWDERNIRWRFFDKETFGALAAMIKAKDINHAIELSESSNYGLGINKNNEKALKYAHKVSDGLILLTN